MDSAVVEAERDGVEHVLPVALLPLAVLADVDPQRGVAGGHDRGHFSLGRPAVSDDTLADGLGRIGGQANTPVSGQEHGGPDEAIQVIEPGNGMMVRLLDDDRSWSVRADPLPELTAGFRKSPPSRQVSEGEDAAVGQTLAGEDGVAEFPEARIEGEESVTSLGHFV